MNSNVRNKAPGIKPLFYFYFKWNNLRSFFHQESNEKISMLTAERDKLNTERSKFRDENEKLNKQLQRIQETEKVESGE